MIIMGVQGIGFGTANSKTLENVSGNASTQKDFLNLNSVFDVPTETMDLDILIDTTAKGVKKAENSMITDEQLEALIGKLTQEEYDKIIKELEDNYNERIEELENMLKKDCYEKIKELNNYLEATKDGAILNERDYNHYKELFAKYGIDINNRHDIESYKQSVEEAEALLKNEINMLKNNRDSAKYDYMCFLKEYADYNMDNNEELKASLYEDAKAMNGEDYFDQNKGENESYNPYVGHTVYSYKEYQKKHPEVSPMEFIHMLPEGGVAVDIDNYNELMAMNYVYENNPNYAKVYSYLYDQDPVKAKEYLKAIKYETNDLQAQIIVSARQKSLIGKDTSTVEQVLLNHLGVGVLGTGDGMQSYVDGLSYAGGATLTAAYHIASALGLYDGEIYEDRTKSVNELVREYTAQTLMNKEDKVKAGLLSETGENKDPNSIIDYSQDYAGQFLDTNYDISKIVGSSVASYIAKSIHPMMGTVSDKLSSGGDSYHKSMIQGNDYVASVAYSILKLTNGQINDQLFKSIPGLDEEAALAAEEYIKKYISSTSKDVAKDVVNDIVNASLEAKVMGKKLPTTAEGWADYLVDKTVDHEFDPIKTAIKKVLPDSSWKTELDNNKI